jgi:hypothetical protein
MSNNILIDLLEQIIFGNQRGTEITKQLESAIIEQYPNADDDERFEQILHVLASYNPDGGQYMYNESALVEECRKVLSLLKGYMP